MTEQRISSFAELHEALGHLRRDAGWVWRGQSDAAWPLLPSAGRDVLAGRAALGQDEVFFKRWQAEARQFLGVEPEDEWQWLALAHHSGFATRLLSWSTRPLAAAWFAVAGAGKGDAVVHALKPERSLLDTAGMDSPWKTRYPLVMYTPRRLPEGLSRDIGVVTLHTPPTHVVDADHDSADRLERFVIAASYRRELLFELNQYGINRATLFPGLAGLARHFNWVQRSFSYWAEGLRSAG